MCTLASQPPSYLLLMRFRAVSSSVSHHGPCGARLPEPSPSPSRAISCLRRRGDAVTGGPAERTEPTGVRANQRTTRRADGDGESGQGCSRMHCGRARREYAVRYDSRRSLDSQMWGRARFGRRALGTRPVRTALVSSGRSYHLLGQVLGWTCSHSEASVSGNRTTLSGRRLRGGWSLNLADTPPARFHRYEARMCICMISISITDLSYPNPRCVECVADWRVIAQHRTVITPAHD